MIALRTPLVLLGAFAMLAGCDATGIETSPGSRASGVSEVKVYTTSDHKVYQFETDGVADLQFDIQPFLNQPEEFEIASVYMNPGQQNVDYIRFYQEWDEVDKVYKLYFTQDGNTSRDALVTLYSGPDWPSRYKVVDGLAHIPTRSGAGPGAPFASLTTPGKSYHTNPEGETVIDYDPGSGGSATVTLMTTMDSAGQPVPIAYSGITYIVVTSPDADSPPPNQIRIHVGRRADVFFESTGSSIL